MRFTINYVTNATQVLSTGVKPVRVAVTIKLNASCYGIGLRERTQELAAKHDFAMLHRGDTLKGVFKRTAA